MDRVRRPKATVLSDSALVPQKNLEAPPSHFTHEVIAEQPYYYTARLPAASAGMFAAGTKVKLHGKASGQMCRVVDARGLRVMTACRGLRPLA